jgi:ATP-dependent Clp protease ATP-binding subunit ClpA
MPVREWSISVLHRTLDDSVLVTEPLLFPELCCCDSKAARLGRAIRDGARHILERTAAQQLHQRVMSGEPEVEQMEVALAPPKRQVEWVEPVSLRFDVVRWVHGNEGYLVFVPALGIAIVARRQPELAKMLNEHVLSALRRSKAAESLFSLALTQRDNGLRLETVDVTARHRSPKQIVRDDEDESDSAKKLVIKEVGVVLGDGPLRPAFEIDWMIEQLVDLLTGRSPRSVLLVGPSGVGKTAAVNELVRRRDTYRLGNTPVWSTSGARLIAGVSGFGMWQQRCRVLCKEAARDGAILHLGNLVELMEVGRVDGSPGIAGFLKTPLSRGDLLAIAECTPEQLAVIERQDPYLLELFQVLKVEEPGAEVGMRILRQVAAAEGCPDSMLTTGWLATLDRLHRRYATFSAAPGRPVRFLRNLLKDRSAGQPIGPGEVIAAFSRETGLPLAMLDLQVPLNLSVARGWFASRLIGQGRAVDQVTDLLATVKAMLTRPRRPIASLLFIGPTGVGKTEMAKALAEYFFGDRNRLTRFDMSEFASPAAVERLFGGTYAAEGLLTAKVREQPFSVLLFDEFEKAHPGFFDLLLQVLGDGRLTDAAGRLGDFSNTIVIMTSNLGAESFNRGTFGLTRGSAYPDPESHFTSEVRGFVRPELFNRIDRIVPFLPLGAESILQIAERELTLVEQRDGFKLRGLSMAISSEARQHLAEMGYDIRYGARPLKRAIERQLLAPLAEALNRYPTDVQLLADVALEQAALIVNVRARVDAAGKTASAVASGTSAASAADACSALRRDVQRLNACPSLLTVSNLLFQLEREQQRKQAKQKANRKPVYDATLAERISELRQITDAVESLSTDVNEVEDLALSAVYGTDADVDSTAMREKLLPLESRLFDLLIQLLARQSVKPHAVLIGIYGSREALLPLASVYDSIARTLGYQVEACWFEIYSREQFRRNRVTDVARLFESPPATVSGIALMIKGPFASLRFAPEAGGHSLTRDGNGRSCQVEASDKLLGEYFPPEPKSWPKDNAVDPRRTYDVDKNVSRDQLLKTELRWTGRSIEPIVADAIELQLRKAARAVIDA